ncbi:MAG: AAA domain-containing protein [bacterium]
MSLCQIPNINEKAVRLVEYLRRLASLRSPLVREITGYEMVLWVGGIPQQKGCFTQAWGRDEKYDPDIWIEVQSRREPELPSVPEQCQNWVNENTLRNKNELPELLSSITIQDRNPNWKEGSNLPELITCTARLEDHPEIQSAWDRWVEERWLPWTEEHNAWESIHKIYSELFAIHQEQMRLGEEYELVLGLGLLIWQTPSGHRVCRHLIVANALLEFEARLAKFTVRPNPDGAKLRPELDMLDIKGQPAHAEEEAKRALTAAGDDPWEKDCIEGVLQALVRSINSQGEYDSALEGKSVRASGKPVVKYAPALILRKRCARGLTEILNRIKGRIEKGEDIPREFLDLAEIQSASDVDSENDSGEVNSCFDGEVFFPKPSNEEQRRIVEMLRRASLVLVQGPPGTGKSHTIANLICHLLATGQRTLITAKTPRALQVLEGLIPDELRPLCINVLGSGREEKRSMESSVGGILRKKDEWSEKQAARVREELEQKLRELREEKAKINRRLRDIRESEVYSHSIAEGTYRGTAARIAEAMNRNRSTYEWFTDTVPLDGTCPISESDLRNVLGGLRRFTAEKRQELIRPRPKDLLSPERVSTLFEHEKKAIEEESRSAKGADEQLIADHLSRMEAETIKAIHDSLSAFLNEYQRLSTSPHAWICEALRDVAGGNSSMWRDLHCVTRDTITSIEPLASVADDTTIDFPDTTNIRALREDACKLKEHMENGGKLGWWGPFRPKLVKERAYVLKTVRINGRSCSTLEHISVLADALYVRIACEKAWRFWAGRCKNIQGPYTLQLHRLKALYDALTSVLSIETLIEQCRKALQHCPHLGESIWTNELQVRKIIASCRLALDRQAKRLAIEEIRRIEAPLMVLVAKSGVHPITGELLQSLRQRDPEGFARAWNKLHDLDRDCQHLHKVNEDINKLRHLVPRLVGELERTCNDACWNSRVQEIESAWHWAQARFWVEEYIRKEDAPNLARRARQIEDEISITITKLAALHAWSFCFSRLQDKHQRHMVAWQQEMKKYGKGTGKHAHLHLREAQKHLNECREAVPAWVMPLHRVWDTIDPSPGMFDVIIVDEASQCGFEALPLFYLGKKILIVGDDKQISPDAVGLSRDDVHGLMEEFLHDFRFRSSFDVESSLFAHGKLRCGNRQIILREHFRCMPEIIRFSNDLWYFDTPLIPLRQYGPDRLTPLEHVFVRKGYRQGSDSRAINHPEADAIAEKIVELCKDPRYTGKTMGVVVLQGDAQSGLIEEKLLKLLGAEEMEMRRLICGNPYSFQGDERDIIFLSMVAATNDRIGPLAKAADERRFNVAASRARDQMWLFHSVQCNDLSTHCLRRTLLKFFEDTRPRKIAGIDRDELERRAAQDNRSVVKAPPPFESWFEVNVALELIRRGYLVIPQYEVAGKRIDLVVEGGRTRLAVECDGDEWHGVDRYEEDMQRKRQLERCGWVFFNVRESEFYADKQRVMEHLYRLLDERGIVPQIRLQEKESDVKDVKAAHDVKVQIGDTVIYVDIQDPQIEKHIVISNTKSNPDWGIVNVNTPIAQALLGSCINDKVEAKLPRGSVHLLVKAIKKPASEHWHRQK